MKHEHIISTMEKAIAQAILTATEAAFDLDPFDIKEEKRFDRILEELPELHISCTEEA